jgi:hypothetical protein
MWSASSLGSGTAIIQYICNNFPGLISRHSDVIMFADDTTILITNANHDEVILDFKSVLSQISKWFQAISLY